MDVETEPERNRRERKLSHREVALQWLAVQTQPQLCSRFNLLLTGVGHRWNATDSPRSQKSMIQEVRREPARFEFLR